ncbi:hypothetical protein DRH27_03030 [Candidatus Falkowbacteria bacterium]|nr:MAG: hypothetical protein DRH27_03030 [Candidatus Falkowbacteria bacterium]
MTNGGLSVNNGSMPGNKNIYNDIRVRGNGIVRGRDAINRVSTDRACPIDTVNRTDMAGKINIINNKKTKVIYPSSYLKNYFYLQT